MSTQLPNLTHLLRAWFPRESMVPVMLIRPATRSSDKPIMAVFATTTLTSHRPMSTSPVGVTRNVSREVADLLGWKWSKHAGVLVEGDGRDVYYSLVSALSRALHGDVHALTYLDVWDPDNFED